MEYIDGFRKKLASGISMPVFERVSITGQDVATDGSCMLQNFHQIRFAASSVVLPDLTTIKCALPGPDQSAPRAEIYGFLLAICATVGNMVVFIDCQYVVDTANCLIKDLDFCPSDDADLWKLVKQAMIDRPHGVIRVQKVKGHATIEYANTPMLAHEKRMNDRADEAAVQALQLHELPENHCSMLLHEYSKAAAYQARCIKILLDRKRNDYANKYIDLGPPPETMLGNGYTTSNICACTPNRRCPAKTRICQYQPAPCRSCLCSNTVGMTEDEYCEEIKLRPYTEIPGTIVEIHAKYCKQPGLRWRSRDEACNRQPGLQIHDYILLLEATGISTVDGAKCTWHELTIDYLIAGGDLQVPWDKYQEVITIGMLARRFAAQFKAITKQKYHTTTGITTLKTFQLGAASGIKARPTLLFDKVVFGVLLHQGITIVRDKLFTQKDRQHTTFKWSFDSSKWHPAAAQVHHDGELRG